MKNYHNEVANVSHGVKNFFDKTFSNVHIEGPPLKAEEIQKHPLMVVSTHRSHVDYFFLGNALYWMGFKNLRFAAGDNLTKLPWIGPRFRAFGAFTVSRDSGFERNYVRNLCNQVMKMLENRDAVLVFPEGGRSYTGETLDIKGGILNAALMTQASTPDNDVYLFPVAVSYECPPDVPFFPMLLKGKKLRKKNNSIFKRMLGNVYYFGADILAFVPLLLARRTGRKYGEIYMDYLAPVSVRSLVDLKKNRIRNARDEFSAHRASLEQISKKIHRTFVSLFRILPIHVISAALKEKGSGCPVSELDSIVADLKKTAVRQGRNVKSLENLTASQLVEKGLEQLRRIKAVNVKNGVARVCKDHIIEYFSSALSSKQENS
ncbi:MAG: 1-acyl-sn-glycerol-3-phosphate acyltransferase [Chitinispirillaceae bacterium]